MNVSRRKVRQAPGRDFRRRIGASAHGGAGDGGQGSNARGVFRQRCTGSDSRHEIRRRERLAPARTASAFEVKVRTMRRVKRCGAGKVRQGEILSRLAYPPIAAMGTRGNRIWGHGGVIFLEACPPFMESIFGLSFVTDEGAIFMKGHRNVLGARMSPVTFMASTCGRQITVTGHKKNALGQGLGFTPKQCIGDRCIRLLSPCLSQPIGVAVNETPLQVVF
jgi:hypothetical protein